MRKGDIIDGYTITSLIGEGGFGKVWAVEKDGQSFALKVCIDEDPDSIARFERECRISLSLDHTNLVHVISVGNINDCPYFVMERCDKSLQEASELGIPIESKFEYAISICDGVFYIHSKGILHRDIKPANVLLKNNTAKISDFGSGRFLNRDTRTITMTQERYGSYGYIAPEVFLPGGFKNYVIESDIFSLGGLIYSIFTDGAIPVSINPKYIPGDIFPIVQKCTTADINDRYHSASEIKRDLVAARLARESFRTMQEVYQARENLSPNEIAARTIPILSLSTTISEVLGSFLYINAMWKTLLSGDMSVADKLAPTVISVFANDENAWIDFRDVDTLARMVVNLFDGTTNLEYKIKLLKIGIYYTVSHNRWEAIKEVCRDILYKLDTNSIAPYVPMLKDERESLFHMQETISLPPLVKSIIVED